MTGAIRDGGIDIALDRLRITGLDLSPEQAETMGRAVEAEIRRLMVAGELAPAAATRVVPLSDPPDMSALVQIVAARVVVELEPGFGRG